MLLDVFYFKPHALVSVISTDKCSIILVNIYRKLMCTDRCAAWTTKALSNLFTVSVNHAPHTDLHGWSTTKALF